MIVAVSLVSIALFAVAFWSMRVIPVAAGAFATAQGAIEVMRDATMDDDAREKAARNASVRLLKTLASILLRCIAVLAVALAPIYASDLLGLAPSESVMMFLSRWEVILGATVVISAVYLANVRLRPRQ